MKPLHLLVVGTAASLATLCSASAASVSSSSTAPSIYYFGITSASSNVRWQYTGATTANTHRDVGQLFKVGTSNIGLESITVQVASVAGGIGNSAAGSGFSISIYEFASNTSVSPLGAALHSEQAVLPETLTGGDYLTLSLGTSYELQAGHYYAVMLAFDAAQTGRALNFVTASGAAYTDGGARFYSNSTANDPTQVWLASGGNLQIYLGATPIPEPGDYALLALGVGMVMIHRRFRKTVA